MEREEVKINKLEYKPKSKFVSFLKAIFVSNIGIKIGSIVAAFVIWVLLAIFNIL